MEPDFEFVVIDVETTGLDSQSHEIIEIGALLFTPACRSGTQYELISRQSLIKPKKSIPPFITKLTGITNEMTEHDGTEIDLAIPHFESFIAGRRLVAFNASFDTGFLRAAGMKIEGPVSCALQMARSAWPDIPSHKLDYLTKIMNFKISGQPHRALADCQSAFLVYIAAMLTLGRCE